MVIQSLQSLSGETITVIAFKVFAIFFSIFYLLYALVIAKQVQVMNKTLEVKNNQIFDIISSAQITAGLILIILAIIFL